MDCELADMKLIKCFNRYIYENIFIWTRTSSDSALIVYSAGIFLAYIKPILYINIMASKQA